VIAAVRGKGYLAAARKEGWHPESEWGAACAVLPPPMPRTSRPTA